MLVSAIALAALSLAIWAFVRKRRPARRWQIVSDGAGHFSFFDGKGYLYPIDYPSLRQAAVKMSEIKAGPPQDLDESWRNAKARETRYSKSPALSAPNLDEFNS